MKGGEIGRPFCLQDYIKNYKNILISSTIEAVSNFKREGGRAVENGNAQTQQQFHELLVSLARIEEGIKPIAEIKKDVKQLQLGFVDVDSSLKSAHKRIDAIEKKFENMPTQPEFNNNEKRISKLETHVTWVATLIIGAVITAIVGVVLVG